MNKHCFKNLLIGLAMLAWLATACARSPVQPTVAPVLLRATPLPTATATLAPTDTPEPTSTPTVTLPSTSAVELLPELPEGSLMTLLEIGGILYEKADYEGAEVLYSELLQHEMPIESMSIILALRADTLWKQGDFEAALANYKQAEHLGNQEPKILNQLCWIYAITAQPDLALPYCERAMSGEPSPARRDSRGLVYAQLGRTEEAAADFQAVIDDLQDETSPDLKKIYDERQNWLADLQAGKNPISPQVLTQLRADETHESIPLWDPGTEVDRTRATLMEGATRTGFRFDPVTEIEGQEGVIGKLSNEGCLVEMSLIGPESGLKGAFLNLAGCPDDVQSSYVEWFMNSFLLTHADEIRATVWQITDLYSVIQGEQTEQVSKEIGDVTFTAEMLPGSPPAFQLTARVGE